MPMPSPTIKPPWVTARVTGGTEQVLMWPRPPLTQQVGALVHIPYEPRPRGRQLLEQGVGVAVERHVLDALGGSAGTVKATRRVFILCYLTDPSCQATCRACTR